MRKLALLLILLSMMTQPARAHEVPDLSRTGCITVTIRCDGEPIPGCEMSMYRVGEIRESDGNYSFICTDDFLDSGIALENPQSAQVAKDLANYAIAEKMKAQTRIAGEDGAVAFRDLEPGLYLIRQSKAPDGYEKAAPFLVTLPMLVDGEYIYRVDASPKAGPVEKHEEPNPEQPKTGQPAWPIWMFLLSGAGLLTIVMKRRY